MCVAMFFSVSVIFHHHYFHTNLVQCGNSMFRISFFYSCLLLNFSSRFARYFYFFITPRSGFFIQHYLTSSSFFSVLAKTRWPCTITFWYWRNGRFCLHNVGAGDPGHCMLKGEVSKTYQYKIIPLSRQCKSYICVILARNLVR